MRLLIVEDEKSLADILKKGLEEEGNAVRRRSSGCGMRRLDWWLAGICASGSLMVSCS